MVLSKGDVSKTGGGGEVRHWPRAAAIEVAGRLPDDDRNPESLIGTVFGFRTRAPKASV